MSAADLFLHPGAVGVLLLAPLVWLAFELLERARRRRLARLVGGREAALVQGASRTRRTIRRTLYALAVLLALVAALGPRTGGSSGGLTWRGVDIVVLLDLSRSMRAKDLVPDRLGRARAEIRALAECAEGDRLALVVFAGDARLAVPLTRDRASFQALVDLEDPSDVRRGGTDLGAALDAALDALEEAGDGPGAVVLLTDGEDLERRGARAASRLAERGIPVHAVGLGSPLGSKIALHHLAGDAYLRDRSGADVVSSLDVAGLERITRATGGAFLRAAREGTPLADLYEDSILPLAREASASDESDRRENGYQGVLLLALLLALIEVALGRSGAPVGRRPSRAAAAALLPLLLLAGCDRTEAGRRAYDAGRPNEALAAFDRALADAGDGASAALHHNRAIAALALGAWDEAESAAREAEARGDLSYAGLDAFVRGTRAFAMSHAAERGARTPGADARALLPALKLAEDALAAWQWAAASRPEWPEAARNVERSLLWLGTLRERRSEGRPDDRPPPPPPPAPTPEDAPPDPRPEVIASDLSPGKVLGLLDVLAEKERSKRAERAARRRARSVEVERDW